MEYFYESIAEIPELKPVIDKLDQISRWNTKLEIAITDYIQSDPFSLTSQQVDEVTTQYFVENFVAPPPTISDIAIASFNSARSLLNYCAQILADSPVTSLASPTKRKQIQFPISRNESDFVAEICTGRLGHPNLKTITRISKVQPFSDLSQLFRNEATQNQEIIDPTKHFLHEIQAASNNEKHYSDPQIIAAIFPEFAYPSHPDAGIWPNQELKMVQGAKLHKTKIVGPIDRDYWKLNFYLFINEFERLQPLLGWVHSYEWFIKYVFLPHIFEDVAADFHGRINVTREQ